MTARPPSSRIPTRTRERMQALNFNRLMRQWKAPKIDPAALFLPGFESQREGESK